MRIERSEMARETKAHMRDGKGSCTVTQLGGPLLQKHCRVLSEIVIPVGASIGPHPHVEIGRAHV